MAKAAGKVTFFCRTVGDQPDCPGGRRAHSSLSGDPRTTFCGFYFSDTSFLDDSFKRTMVHELVHVVGIATMRYTGSQPPESYYGDASYPGTSAAEAMNNPDSFAAFAYVMAGRLPDRAKKSGPE
jgi:hypothetical protein